MRGRPLLWIAVSVACFIAAGYFWRLGNRWAAEKKPAPPATQRKPAGPLSRAGQPFQLLSQPGLLNATVALDAARAPVTNGASHLAYRLTNTPRTVTELSRVPTAVLLENALVDTAYPVSLGIPEHLRAKGDAGAYIVQARGPLDNAFRAVLRQAGASIVSYIPNNSYLVRASAQSVERLRSGPWVNAVLPYEPYYKLKSGLLKAAVEQSSLPPGGQLNVLVFPDARDEVANQLVGLGAELVAEDRSPFGPVLRVIPPPGALPEVAGLSGVQELETVRTRLLANDLSRVALGVTVDTQATNNYMDLGQSSNVLVSINDAGVDETHPDLQGRVFTDNSPNFPVRPDTSGHGTHVAGIIAGDGSKSDTVASNVDGSIMPAVVGQFRGKTSKARLFSMNYLAPDWYLQERAALTNAFISNNSWNYDKDNEYDLAAASYDAAVRDALPGLTGARPLLFVFSAGNAGAANDYFGGQFDSGTGGTPDGILSPGTAKNVITVGAIEQLRNITNEIYACDSAGTNCVTNTIWLATTDSSDQVAGFSSRGNVGIGIEGDTGRFKPDVVAPGTFVISTRSADWDENAYYNPVNILEREFVGQVAEPHSMYTDVLPAPDSAVLLSIELFPNPRSPVPFPILPIYVRQNMAPTNAPGEYDFVTRNNRVSMPPDNGGLTLAGVNWYFGVDNETDAAISFDVVTRVGLSNANGNVTLVLSNLNESLGPYYRYESGTSLAAGQVSGTLALMQEFFQDRLKMTNSPALMKALVINGARSANGDLYDFQVNSAINYQGWGLVNLPNSLPMSLSNLTSTAAVPTGSMLLFDQSPTNALATGQSRTYQVQLDPVARELPLRITLVWSDPPANPIASIKLVNDLDLIVTNLETGEIFFGNDIASAAEFNSPWNPTNDPPTAPNLDTINNVENVYLNSTFLTTLGSNYTITVKARHVNVNAVTAHTNDVVQDYALVISSGNGEITNALQLVSAPVFTSPTEPFVTAITNMFGENSTDKGGILMHQHVGANTPLLGTNQIPLPNSGVLTAGMTNQWHFYVLTNDTDFTNAAFLTFLPPNLAVPRMGTRTGDKETAVRPEADIDLYVSMNSGLTNLDTNVINSAWKSQSRGGTETIVISNATRGVFYIGVKSEDQQAAEYAILGVISQLPFGGEDNGNVWMRCFPLPASIPDGSPQKPGGVFIFGIAMSPIKTHRVIVSNIITHELYGDLVGTLTHANDFATLNNHTTNIMAVQNQLFIYDDSEERNVPGAEHTDGPGSLMDFAGKPAIGQWMLTMVDNAPSHVGYVSNQWIYIEKQQDPQEGITATIAAGGCREDYIDIPPDATNLTVSVSLLSGVGPVSLTVCPLESTGGDCVSTLISNSVSGFVTLDTSSFPPLGPGTYAIRTCNLGILPVDVYILARVYVNPNAIAVTAPSSTGPVALKDDAVTYAFIDITNHLRIVDLDIGLLIEHPRISDLAITLISPNGTRVVLFEDRGAWSPSGLGSFSTQTNQLGLPVVGYTNLTAFYTNDFESAAVGPYGPSARLQGWTVLSNMVAVVPDLTLPWLSNNVLVLADGTISNSLPTAQSNGTYRLTFKASHAPYLVGTVGWWPMDESAAEIFSGLDGLLFGNVVFSTGRVSQAFYGDGSATRMVVPRCPELNVGQARGFSLEGWIYPSPISAPSGISVFSDGFENATPQEAIPAGTTVSGWLVESGDVDVMTDGQGFIGNPDTGKQALDLNGTQPGSISRSLTTKPGTNYVLNFAYTKNPSPDLPGYPDFVAKADVSIGSLPVLHLAASARNSYTNLNWAHTSIVFTASSPATKLKLTSLNSGNGGMYLDSFELVELTGTSQAAPIVQWSGSNNAARPGVQLWLSGLADTNVPGALYANIPDTNGQRHVAFTAPFLVTNGGWQHVGLSYDGVSRVARFYVNGNLTTTSRMAPTNFVPGTAADLYFGYDPTALPAGRAFAGGLDEFGLYERVLTDQEMRAIFRAGSNGKYGTNVLSCPVAMQVTLKTDVNRTYTFTNGLAWTNGPRWEINTIDFANSSTNYTPIIIRPLDPNVALDDFVLSVIRTNELNGLLHFTDDTNIAPLPIKFAPAPFVMTNFPPVPFFTNDFENADSRMYTNGETIEGITSPVFGPRDWTVTAGKVMVVSNNPVAVDGTNFLVLATGAVSSELPTEPGRRYEITYRVRGPGAVGWWSGDINPLDRRALDLVGGNDGAFIDGATNVPGGLVAGFPGRTSTALYLKGFITNGVNGHPDIATKLELGDPENLALTNALTIEGWIKPVPHTNNATEQIFFRGDSRTCLDPYYLALDRVDKNTANLRLHIEDDSGIGCGVNLMTTNGPISRDSNSWQHVAAVYDSHVVITNAAGKRQYTNQMKLYVNGVCLASNYTAVVPFRDLDPGFSPGVAIGNRSRDDYSQPFHGYIDDLTVYGRALTDPEIRAIYAAGAAGKADLSVAPDRSLARVAVSLNGLTVDYTYGDNAEWTMRTFDFTASKTNTVLGLQGLLPGTQVGQVRLVELPTELSYQPEQPLDSLNGQDAYGRWLLEIWDTRAGATNGNTTLVNWQLDFKLSPFNPPPVMVLSHGIPVTNTIAGRTVQEYLVNVPQWALRATNTLLYAVDRANNPANLGVLYDTNTFITVPTNYLFWPPVSSGTIILATNAGSPRLMLGQPYFLTVTNTNTFAVTYALGVEFDITTLTNCLSITNVVGPAGIPRYFQFDVPTNSTPPDWPQNVSFWLNSANSNLTVVLSQHLPLPDLAHFDYISAAPSTNQEIVTVVTNSTPFPVQTNRWYVGVFNSEATNVAFRVHACYQTNYPTIVTLTNDVPFVAPLGSLFVARPGPPRWFFFEFQITNFVPSVLFELYGLSGDADLVLQRSVLPTMAPYFDASMQTGRTPEQIVVRLNDEISDLRGNWYLGVYNNEPRNVSYTIQATLPGADTLLLSALPLNLNYQLFANQALLAWNSVEGENYKVQYSTSIASPIIWTDDVTVVASTPLSTYQVPILGNGMRFYRVLQVPAPRPPPVVTVRQLNPTQVEISWPTTYAGYVLQYAVGQTEVWYNWDTVASPITTVGNTFVTTDTIGPVPRFYRITFP